MNQPIGDGDARQGVGPGVVLCASMYLVGFLGTL